MRPKVGFEDLTLSGSRYEAEVDQHGTIFRDAVEAASALTRAICVGREADASG